MSEFTKKLLMNLSMVGNASRRLIDMPELTKAAPAQQRVLNILAEEDGLTQGILADILDVRPSSLAEVLKKLELRGDIRRCEDKNDKRIKNVFLTDIGRRKVTTSTEEKDQSVEFFSGLSLEKQKELDQLLKELVNGWPIEFRQSVDIPHSPRETLEVMQKYRDEFIKRFEDKDMADLSSQQRHQKECEWKESMKDLFENHVRGQRKGMDSDHFHDREMNHDCFQHPNMNQFDWWQRHFRNFGTRGFHNTNQDSDDSE